LTARHILCHPERIDRRQSDERKAMAAIVIGREEVFLVISSIDRK